MSLLSLLLLAVWTLVVIRVLCARATLSERALVTYLLAGVLLGTVISPVIQKLFAPYNETTPWVTFFVSLARQSVLLLPLLRVLRVRALSMADAFLSAFLLGFGFDLSTAVLAVGLTGQPLRNLALFPPWQFADPTFSVAGYGYWTALVALAFAGSQRFIREPKKVWVITGIIFLWVVIEAATLWVSPTGLLAIVATITFHGKLTAWIALLAVIALSIYEAQWAEHTVGAAQQSGFRLLTEWQSLLERLARGNFKDYARLSEQFAFQRQVELTNAEMRASRRDQTLFRLNMDLQRRLQETREAPSSPVPPPVIVPPGPLGWLRNPRVALLAGWLALLFVVGVLPRLPTGWGQFLWSFWLFHYRPPAFPFTLLNAVLVLILVRRYLFGTASPPAAATPNDSILLQAEKLVLDSALAAILLIWIHGRPELLYPFPSTAERFGGIGLPSLSPLQLSTLLLLFATAATGSAAIKMQRWWETPPGQRRRAVLRNGLWAATALLVVWICNAFYPTLVALVHLSLGSMLYGLFGRGGNYYAAILSLMLMVLAGAALYAALQPVSRRIERFFVD